MKYLKHLVGSFGLIATITAFAAEQQTVKMSAQDLTAGFDQQLNELQQRYEQYSFLHPEFAQEKVEIQTLRNPFTGATKRKVTMPMSIQGLNRAAQSKALENVRMQPVSATVSDSEYRYNCPHVGSSWGNENIAASYSGDCSLLATEDFQSANANLSASVRFKNFEAKVLEFTGAAATGASGRFAVSTLGIQVWSTNGNIINANPSFYREVSHTGSYPIWGPLDVAYELKAGGTVGASINVRVLDDAKLVSSTVRPYVNVDGTATADVNIFSFGGVEGYGLVKILFVETPVSANVGYNLATKKFTAALDANYDYNAMGGDVGVKAWYNIGSSSNEYKYPLYRWDGYFGTGKIASEIYPKSDL